MYGLLNRREWGRVSIKKYFVSYSYKLESSYTWCFNNMFVEIDVDVWNKPEGKICFIKEKIEEKFSKTRFIPDIAILNIINCDYLGD